MRSARTCKSDLNFAISITFDHEIVWLLVFAEKENEFSALTSEIFQVENVLQ